MKKFILTDEQKEIIEMSVKGKNIFVDAVIGSGKTTILREIVKKNKDKKILYLTYNRLLKEDAKKMIQLGNAEIQNYHGFVYKYLTINKYPYSNQNGIKDFIYRVEKGDIKMPQFDMIVIDEYQDINNETGELLKTIDFYQDKKVQLIFVGDMKQKIYDTTTIDVINDVVLKLRSDYINMDLTNCFRISKDYATKIGNIWGKKINGTNLAQKTTKTEFSYEKLIAKLNEYENKDILILTPFRNNITLNQFISRIEKEYPEKYNKTNLYITIGSEANISPVKDSMIVTTYDGSKGLERQLTIVFGWDEGTLGYRSQKGNKEIIKNLYLVAASRGKKEIIFIESENDKLLNEKNFERNLRDRVRDSSYKVYNMYDFVFDSELHKLFSMLNIKQIETEEDDIIIAKTKDYNISLLPAIQYYQQIIFFNDWKYEKIMESFDPETPIFKYVSKIHTKDKRKQALLLAALATNLTRYAQQATTEFMEKDQERKLYERLYSQLSPNDNVNIKINTRVLGNEILGMIDVVKDGIPWFLAYTDELEKKHFLQAATYSYMLESEYAMVWNTKNNRLYKVFIEDIGLFEEQMVKTIRKE